MRPGPTVVALSALALAALALAAGCRSAPAARATDDPRPTALRVRVGRQWFGTHEVTLRGDTLVADFQPMMGSERPSVTRVVPTREAWREFRAAAERAGVRAWPRECRNAGIVDGGGFALELAWPDARVEASGTNAFPRRDGSCRTDGVHTDEVRDLFGAVSRLIGRPYP